MLVLTIKSGKSVIIGDNIEVQNLGDHPVRFGIRADNLAVQREEIVDEETLAKIRGEQPVLHD